MACHPRGSMRGREPRFDGQPPAPKSASAEMLSRTPHRQASHIKRKKQLGWHPGDSKQMCAVNGRAVRASTALGTPGPCTPAWRRRRRGTSGSRSRRPLRTPGPDPGQRGAGARSCGQSHRCGATCVWPAARDQHSAGSPCGQGGADNPTAGAALAAGPIWDRAGAGAAPGSSLGEAPAEGGWRQRLPDGEASASSWTSARGQAHSCASGGSFAH